MVAAQPAASTLNKTNDDRTILEGASIFGLSYALGRAT
jgi:hypothetical protein